MFGDRCEREFSNVLFDLWIKARSDESKYLAQQNRELNNQNSAYYKYLQYLDSKEWKVKRVQVLKRDKNLCQGCKEKPAEQIHHLTYDRLYKEFLEDLVSLCVNCHEREHKEPFLDLTQKNPQPE
ncbi:HNH endonuclease [Dyadobacter sp. 32]|uniref:HNH endonuclease n=1 Tax=Dyadobacter sp. 32 TaxID=538966 RepID=UPI0011EF1C23